MIDLSEFEAALGQTDEFDVLSDLILTQLTYIRQAKADADSADVPDALMLLNEALEAVADAVALLSGAA